MAIMGWCCSRREHWRYRAWGGIKGTKLLHGEEALTGNAIRAQGQYHDEETGLYYNRHRYYDPYLGRFITQDPIGLAGGTLISTPKTRLGGPIHS